MEIGSGILKIYRKQKMWPMWALKRIARVVAYFLAHPVDLHCAKSVPLRVLSTCGYDSYYFVYISQKERFHQLIFHIICDVVVGVNRTIRNTFCCYFA